MKRTVYSMGIFFRLFQECNKEPCKCDGIKGARGAFGPSGVPGLEGAPGDIGFDGKFQLLQK